MNLAKGVMKTVSIVGVGNIASRLYREYGKFAPDRYDPAKAMKKSGTFGMISRLLLRIPP